MDGNYLAALGFLPFVPGTIGRAARLMPAESKVWNQLDRFKGKIKMSGKGRRRLYYTWDYTHGNIEVFDRNLKHLGVMDPVTRKIDESLKVKGRTLK